MEKLNKIEGLITKNLQKNTFATVALSSLPGPPKGDKMIPMQVFTNSRVGNISNMLTYTKKEIN